MLARLSTGVECYFAFYQKSAPKLITWAGIKNYWIDNGGALVARS